jgi:coenzyme F420-reducing hydrogenase gamma subunit
MHLNSDQQMQNIHTNNLQTPGAHWFASTSMFCTGMVTPAAVCQVRAAKIDPAASGGPVKGGNP